MNIVALLTEKGLKISTAESCTGGLVAKLITDISGSSACFEMGVVTYSNEAKIKLPGISRQTLDEYGAVSAHAAAQMCEGIMTLAKSDIGLSVTGIAGPSGGTPEKPVGLVYIGVCGRGGTVTEELNLSGTRDEIRSLAAKRALQIATEYIVQNYNS
ncbi:MAG: Nicotinamide-nucleotide amidohydrolase PncC [Firmicutes bacterium ADurb.Bin193]|nr:MAG: Nicotinamide-nucleotide amidohydrolase PncC [Firmicutes bacterium ADurb.Bin193]